MRFGTLDGKPAWAGAVDFGSSWAGLGWAGPRFALHWFATTCRQATMRAQYLSLSREHLFPHSEKTQMRARAQQQKEQ